MEDMENIKQDIYLRAAKEYQDFLNDVTKLPKEEIVRCAYEITIKGDILSILEEEVLSDNEAKALSNTAFPLSAVYNEWLKNDYSHMDLLRHTVSDFAQKKFENQIESIRNPNKKLIDMGVKKDKLKNANNRKIVEPER